jgi:hypothetical protein
LFDMFRGQPPIVGTAIMRRTGLFHGLGQLPQAGEARNQTDAVLKASSTAVEKPAVAFLEANDVLKQVHDFANGAQPQGKDAYVVLFSQTDGGSLQLLRHHSEARIPIGEFKFVKQIHDNFANSQVVGASIIVEPRASRDKERERFRSPERKSPDRPFDRKQSGERPKFSERGSAEKPYVIAAFGRTPLKANILATEENFRRLRLDI